MVTVGHGKESLCNFMLKKVTISYDKKQSYFL